MSVVSNPANRPANQQRKSTTTATLTISSRVGHRRNLIDYFVKAGASDFSDLFVGNIPLMRIYDNLAQAILVSSIDKRFEDMGLLAYLKSIIPNMPPLTAAEDEAITIERNAAPTQIDAYFEDVTDGDVKSRELPGGSLGKLHPIIINMDNNSATTATGLYALDFLDMPTGLSPFTETPDQVTNGRHVTPNVKLTIYAIAADVPKNGASKTDRIHIFENQIELFSSENGEGLLTDPDNGNELAFSLSPIQIFKLRTPYVMDPNNLYTFKGHVTEVAAAHLAAHSQKLFLIGMLEIIGAGA